MALPPNLDQIFKNMDQEKNSQRPKLDTTTPPQMPLDDIYRQMDQEKAQGKPVQSTGPVTPATQAAQDKVQEQDNIFLDAANGVGEFVWDGIVGTAGLVGGTLAGSAAALKETMAPSGYMTPGDAFLAALEASGKVVEPAKGLVRQESTLKKQLGEMAMTRVVTPYSESANRLSSTVYESTGSPAAAAATDVVTKGVPQALLFTLGLRKAGAYEAGAGASARATLVGRSKAPVGEFKAPSEPWQNPKIEAAPKAGPDPVPEGQQQMILRAHSTDDILLDVPAPASPVDVAMKKMAEPRVYSEEEVLTMKYYQGTGAVQVNKALRNKSYQEELRKNDPYRFKQAVDAKLKLDKLMKGHRFTENTIVYRGTEKVKALFGDEIKIGQKITDKGFMSTSSDLKVARQFVYGEGDGVVLKIIAPKGTKGLTPAKVTDVFHGEKETLLDRNLTLEVVDVGKKTEGEPRLITLKVTSDATGARQVGDQFAGFDKYLKTKKQGSKQTRELTAQIRDIDRQLKQTDKSTPVYEELLMQKEDLQKQAAVQEGQAAAEIVGEPIPTPDLPMAVNPLALAESIALRQTQIGKLDTQLKNIGDSTDPVYELVMTERQRIQKELESLQGAEAKNVKAQIEGALGVDLTPKTGSFKFEFLGDSSKKPFVEVKKEALSQNLQVREDGTKVLGWKRNYKDLTKAQLEVGRGALQPGKFVAESNPVVKYIVDTVSSSEKNIERMVKYFLERPKFVDKKGILPGTKHPKAARTEDGALTLWKKMTPKAKQQYIKTVFGFERQGLAASETSLAAAGLDYMQIKTYNMQSSAVQSVVAHVNRAQAKFAPDAEAVPHVPGYLPFIHQGEFRLNVYKGGQLVQVLAANTKVGANKLVKKLEEQGYTAEVRTKTWDSRDRGASVDAFQDAVLYMRNKSMDAERARQIMSENLRLAGYGIGKRGKPGAETEGLYQVVSDTNVKDFETGLKQFIEGGIRYAEGLQLKANLDRVFKDPQLSADGGYPLSLEYGKRYMRNALGIHGRFSKALNDRLDGFGDLVGNYITRNGISKLLGTTRQITSLHRLFLFNPRFLAQTVWQPYQILPSALYNINATGALKSSPWRAMLEAHRAYLKPTAEEAEATRFAINNGTIEPKFIHEAATGEAFSRGALDSSHLFDIVTGRQTAAKLETWSRTMANLTFYRHLRNAGKDHQMAMEQAAYATDKYMVEYNTRERPLLFGSQGLGLVGKDAGLFKTYAFNSLSQQLSFLRTARKTGDYKPLAASLALQTVSAGLGGLILVKEADYILHALGMDGLSDHLLTSGLGDGLVYGPLSTYTDYDLTSSLEATSMMPKDLISFPGLEFVGTVVPAVWEMTKKQLQENVLGQEGIVTQRDALRFWKAVLPNHLHSLVEYAYSEGGEKPVPDDKTGFAFKQRDTQAWVRRFLGSRTMEERRILDSVWRIQTLEKNRAMSKDSMIDVYAWATMNDIRLGEWYWDKMQDLGMTPNEVMGAGKSRIKNINTELLDRLSKYGRTQEGRRKLEELRKSGIPLYE